MTTPSAATVNLRRRVHKQKSNSRQSVRWYPDVVCGGQVFCCYSSSCWSAVTCLKCLKNKPKTLTRKESK